ncbi:hypothetical protein [Labilithrix luteola]|nr:hypothetical protein [Labilithrix luteola]
MGALVCALVVSLGGEADALEAHVEEREVVELTIAGRTDPKLEASLAELLRHAGFSPRFAHVARPSPKSVTTSPYLVAVVSLDLTRVDSIELVIVDARHATVLTRGVPTADCLDEIAREEIGHIVLFAVEAIRRGETVGTPQPRALVLAPPKERARGELETVVTLRTYANVAPVVVGVGAAVGASTRVSSFHLRGLVGFEQRSAVVVTTRAASARFEQRSLRIAVSAGVPLSARTELTLAGGVSADLLAVTTTALRANTERVRNASDLVPVLDATGGITFQLAPRLFVSGAVGAEMPLSTTEYALEAERNVVFLAPDAVRLVGRFSLGVSF